tara:strand:+ start:86897 stop:88894 length:1998 start_codon:yes stop_codon:yes gene_type:complete
MFCASKFPSTLILNNGYYANLLKLEEVPSMSKKRINMNERTYAILEYRWNDPHYKSRRQLIDILKKDFDVLHMDIRKLASLEKRARTFHATELERYQLKLGQYETDMINFEAATAKSVESKDSKKQGIDKPIAPADFTLVELMDRPKSGTLEIYYEHMMVKAKKRLAKTKKIHFITSGQIGADGWDNFWRSIKQYQAYRHGATWVGASTYGRLKVDPETGAIESSMDPIFAGHIVLDENIHFNENICINTMRLRPTLRYPLGGLSSTENGGSEIFIHPKNDLRYVAQTANNLPRAQAASGSCTFPNYSRNMLGQQDKTGELAQIEHVFGGWIVEIEDDKIFHIRPIVADKNGNFCDSFYTKRGKYVSKKFTPTGVQEAEVAGIVTGDSHFATKPKIDLPWKIGTCPKVFDATYGPQGIINLLNIPQVFMHDSFDGHSISHHNEKNSLLLEHMYDAGLLCLRSELDNYWQTYKEILRLTKAKYYDVASNHPEHLHRFITEERFTSKSGYNIINKRIATQLWLDAANDPFCNILENYTRDHLSNDENERLTMLKRDQDFYCEGNKVDLHGDQGANGSRASDKQLHNLGIRCIVGHRHTPGINGLVWTVGTSTYLKVQYTKGLSSWVNTHCLIYKGGQRQLINIIDGRFAYNPALKPANNDNTAKMAA